jgi:3-dehydroquinate synthase class II
VPPQDSGEGKVEGVKVGGRVEKAAESMVADVEAEKKDGEGEGEGDVKRNADGSVCEDCK